MERVLMIHKFLFRGMYTILNPKKASRERINSILKIPNEKALRDDWNSVGEDFKVALIDYGKKYVQ
jgi:hypothetical protein